MLTCRWVLIVSFTWGGLIDARINEWGEGRFGPAHAELQDRKQQGSIFINKCISCNYVKNITCIWSVLDSFILILIIHLSVFQGALCKPDASFLLIIYHHICLTLHFCFFSQNIFRVACVCLTSAMSLSSCRAVVGVAEGELLCCTRSGRLPWLLWFPNPLLSLWPPLLLSSAWELEQQKGLLGLYRKARIMWW